MRVIRGLALLMVLIGSGGVAASGEELAPLPLELPRPHPIGTILDSRVKVRLDPKARELRPPFLAPAGVINVALRKPVTVSDKDPIIGEVTAITDGDKEVGTGSFVEFALGLQWVQVDLGRAHEVAAIVVWFYHGDPRIVHDVVVQISDDADFITGVRTLFNNDHDNSTGLGIGTDFEFMEDYQGHLIDSKSANARYVRIYTKGSTVDEMNRFTEIEVWARPQK